jgi:hypothetical protein
MTEVAKVAIGTEGEAKIEFVDGKARLEAKYAGADASAGAFIEVKASQFVIKGLEYLKAKIPGGVDDIVIDALISKVKEL